MSLLDNGPHTVTVFPEETATDSRGNMVKRPTEVGVVITGCLMTPVRSSRDRDGYVHADYRLMSRELPIGPWSRIEWNGKTLAVIDGPHHYAASEATQHVSAIVREER
jgi:hypothetical protein